MAEYRSHFKHFACGALYGLGLLIIGLVFGGAGHGTSLMLDIATAPIGLIGVVFYLGGAPIMWSMIFGFLSYGNYEKKGFVSVVLICIHYVSAVLVVLVRADPEADYFANMFALNPSIIIIGFLYYFVGQISFWTFYSRISNAQHIP